MEYQYTIYAVWSLAKRRVVYVGYTSQYNNRPKQHKQELRGGYHVNKGLQLHADLFGADDLFFERIITTKFKGRAKSLEKQYIHSLNAEFNMIRSKPKPADTELDAECHSFWNGLHQMRKYYLSLGATQTVSRQYI